MDVVHFDVINQLCIDPTIAVKLFGLKEKDVLVGRIESERLIRWLKAKSSHLLLFENVVPYLLRFPPTCLVEAGFSAAQDVLTQKRHLLQIEHRENLRLKLNQVLQVKLDKLIHRHQPHYSQ